MSIFLFKRLLARQSWIKGKFRCSRKLSYITKRGMSKKLLFKPKRQKNSFNVIIKHKVFWFKRTTIAFHMRILVLTSKTRLSLNMKKRYWKIMKILIKICCFINQLTILFNEFEIIFSFKKPFTKSLII